LKVNLGGESSARKEAETLRKSGLPESCGN
jgi:hypothetical protein